MLSLTFQTYKHLLQFASVLHLTYRVCLITFCAQPANWLARHASVLLHRTTGVGVLAGRWSRGIGITCRAI
ncbi:MAG: hypothetical protein H0X30_21970 [Anaerolineae bacterium]|nr:hypothetical protein [Anaerolineae bacterium]